MTIRTTREHKPAMSEQDRAEIGRLAYEFKIANMAIGWGKIADRFNLSENYTYVLAKEHAERNRLPWAVGTGKRARLCPPEWAPLSDPYAVDLLALLRAHAERYHQERNDIATELDRLKDRYGKLDSILEEMSDLIKSLEAE